MIVQNALRRKIKTPYNNSSYAMRVLEVLQVQFPQANFVSVDTDVATQSRTAHSCDRSLLLYKTDNATIL